MQQYIQHVVIMLKLYSSHGLAYLTWSFPDHKREELKDKSRDPYGDHNHDQHLVSNRDPYGDHNHDQ